MKPRILYFLILGLAVWWFLAIWTPSWIAHVKGRPSFLCFAIELGFSSICHQIPGRSFWIWGHPLSVCARCTGIYAGFLFAVLVFPFLSHLKISSLKVLMVAFLPSVCEFSIAHGTSTNFLRFLVGIPLGIGLGWVFLSGVFENPLILKKGKTNAKSK